MATGVVYQIEYIPPAPGSLSRTCEKVPFVAIDVALDETCLDDGAGCQNVLQGGPLQAAQPRHQ
jgi:hypothetical protein